MKEHRKVDPVVLTIVIVVALVLAVPCGALLALALSLPSLDGRVESADVTASLTIRRDEVGVVRIDASSPADSAWAIGYAHGQDRFFQMDLMRRIAAGEMSALFGGGKLVEDSAQRRWEMRALATQQLAAARQDLVAVMRAYTRGVNAGVNSLKVRPFEYLVLRAAPEPWREEDSLLVIHAMFMMLTDPRATREQFLGRLKRTLPADAFDFVTWSAGAWDSSFIEDARMPAPPALPAPGSAASQDAPREPDSASPLQAARNFMGSSAWAVSGSRTTHSGALLAVDMHLTLSVPNIWYRAEVHLAETARPGAIQSAYGVTLPGFPGFIVGSNGRVAWGLSNSQGDWADILRLTPCELDGKPGYRVDEECVAYRVAQQHIDVAGAPPVTVRFLLTRWGPLVDSNQLAKPTVRRWLGDLPMATNLGFLDLFGARDVSQAIEIARASGLPPVNFVAADSGGRIGWTIAGQLPDRTKGCPIGPEEADSNADDDWTRPRDAGAALRIFDPPAGYIVTANQRILPDTGEPIMCDGAYQLGARARQIALSLAGSPTLSEAAAMHVELDDRARFLERWRDLLLAVIADRPDPHDTRYDVLTTRLRTWHGRASTDSVAYRFIREFRDNVSAEILGMLARGSGIAPFDLYQNLPQSEYPVWRVVSEQPRGWLPQGFEDWHGYLRSVLDRCLRRYTSEDPDLTRLTWGKRNVLKMQHPFLGNIPVLGWFFDMPGEELPGDTNMPRVQAPDFGASERLVVAPGHEAAGLFNMPGGQSSNPLSSYFDAGHDEWVKGVSMPLVAGESRHEIHVTATTDPRGRSK